MENKEQKKFTEDELLRFSLLKERGERIKAQLESTALLNQKLRSELIQWQAEDQAFSNTLKDKYSLAPDDAVDMQSGVITKSQKGS